MKFISYIFGGIDKHFILFITILIIDFLTNICISFYNQKFKTFFNRKMIIKYVGYILILVFAAVIDIIMENENMIRNTIIYFFTINYFFIHNFAFPFLNIVSYLINTYFVYS